MDTKEKEVSPEGSALWKTILITFLKSLIVFVCMVFYVVSLLVCLAPKTASKMFDVFGLDGASSSCYEQIYNKTNKDVDLYNLIERLLRSNNYKKASKYIAELQAKDTYNYFAQKVNKVAIANSEKRYLVYVADLDSYLNSQMVTCLYRSGDKEKAKEFALKDLYENKNPYSFAFGTYVVCVENDKSVTDLKNTFNALYGLVPEGRDMDVGSAMLYKNSNLNESLATSENDRIMRIYTRLRIEYALLSISERTENEDLAESCRGHIESLRTSYENLIK